MGGEQPGDVLAMDFWAAGMPSAATVMQHFNRATNGSRFRVGGVPSLVVNGAQLSASIASVSIEAIMAGVHAHAAVAELWQTWQ
jgi:hypothetical protein